MFPAGKEPGEQLPGGGLSDIGNGLEDRLRGLILNNANVTTENEIINMHPPPANNLPPHMLRASPSEQQEYLSNMASKAAESVKTVSTNTTPLSPQPGKKRMNQAQRRQMNAQLSIPIDSSQQEQQHRQQTAPSPRNYTPHSAQRQSTPSTPQHYNNNHRNNQRFQPMQQQQQFSPQFSHQTPTSPYPPQMPYQNYPRSGGFSNQGSPNLQSQKPIYPQQYQQNQQHFWQNMNQTSPGTNSFSPRPPPQNRQLYQPGPSNPGGQGRRYFGANTEEMTGQSAFLDKLAEECVPKVAIDTNEANKKEEFRAHIEKICKAAIAEHEREERGNKEFDAATVELKCYGSLSSGFATKGSDMDLALLTPSSNPSAELSESQIPRLLEKKLLSLGYGARLLTRTRVPIIKLCEKPLPKLMEDLLEERKKWDSGLGEGQDGDPDEKHLETLTTKSPESTQVDADSQKLSTKTTSNPSSQLNPGNTGNTSLSEKKGITLKQKDHQNLIDYHICAKRALRKNGGRDLSLNSTELSTREAKILDEVCRAFILGLHSEDLSNRLSSYPSISPLFDPSIPFVQRSLNGICTQIEGERLAMAWEKRTLMEATDKQESEALAALEAWKVLQNKTGPLTECEIYNKQLHNASERLKRIHSLRLLCLEQLMFESPQQYFMRVERLKEDLEGKGLPQNLIRPRNLTEEEVVAWFVKHYIDGIHDVHIREALQCMEEIMTLKDVARRHQILQLAKDYEHALESKIYDETSIHHVELYISVLRDLASRQFSVDSSRAELIAIMRTLPDPTQISLNKPRDRYKDHLEFPKDKVGIQCDINFSNHLALHNTLLLRLYSLCDSRVKMVVLFVKHWAKTRGINTPYRGTLGSYGYVLMVLHYLINVAKPPVLPNLQHVNKEPPVCLSPAEKEAQTTCDGQDVRFWRDEAEIRSLAEREMLTQNHDSVGMLLRGFFEYFAQNGLMTTVQGVRGFDWGREVLSLRSNYGILSKQEKGWVGARTVVETTQIAAPPTPASPKTVEGNTSNSTTAAEHKEAPKTVEETKEVRHRYLLAIEDPFEIEHNIARTVTHNGIVSIRDEFRRAWGIIRTLGTRFQSKDGLLDTIPDPSDSQAELRILLNSIHGRKNNEVVAGKI
ncbi:d7cceef8-d6b8-4fc0-9035-617cff30635e [Sclerotinia trifoliorum]|uniref:D7cceef8-d6b8-4fc0-9035-617cff30635e n=1 Tax=Sclerotinia trifoliorum TaxID=28548 RepID=A0A8H2VZR2_9HELO|nr:d7cceef8-d6b8-4fc0-9035-617cff30635e [Sclerotinia trifoliorum]